MDSPFSRFVLDPSENQNLIIKKKRELIRELSKWPEDAPEKLQNWSRKDILEILCAEIGKERKYTSLSKPKLIDNLLKAVCKKKPARTVEDASSPADLSTSNIQASVKRPRKNDHPSRLFVSTNNLPPSDEVSDLRYCQNLACRAKLKLDDPFCKRCSCCICHKYDDNKDPSLWLFCGSDSFSLVNSCGMSCHLECAIKVERAGIMKNVSCPCLDGSYYCVYCGKVNDLLGCWKKQLMVAKDARRVDVLCYRIYLSHKLLSSTEKYRRLHEIVDLAMNKLEAEVGPLTALPNISRGIVNRLSVGAEVQKLCANALDLSETLTSGLSSVNLQAQQARSSSSSFIKFEDVSPTSVTLVLGSEKTAALQDLAGFRLWYKKADTAEYPNEPTCISFKLKGRSLITDLDPATHYKFKIVALSNARELDMWEVEVKTEDMPVNESMDLAPGTSSLKPHCQSPNSNSNGLSNPSEGDESNNNSTAYAVLNKSDESYFDCFEKPEIHDLEKISDHTQNDTSKEKTKCAGSKSEVEVIEPDNGTTGHSDSAIDEEPNSTVQTESHKDSTHSIDNNQTFEIPKSENGSNTLDLNETIVIPFRCSDHTLPVTPCRVETNIETSGRGAKVKPGTALPEAGPTKPDREPVSSKKRSADKPEEVCCKAGSSEWSYEYCVKVIRWLECERHIETNFRVKFLTWFSLYATLQQRKVVNVYVDTLIDDPSSLAGQLVDTFSETICSKRPPPVPTGFCMKLRH